MMQRRQQIPGLGEDETMGQAEAAEKGADVLTALTSPLYRATTEACSTAENTTNWWLRKCSGVSNLSAWKV